MLILFSLMRGDYVPATDSVSALLVMGAGRDALEGCRQGVLETPLAGVRGTQPPNWSLGCRRCALNVLLTGVRGTQPPNWSLGYRQYSLEMHYTPTVWIQQYDLISITGRRTMVDNCLKEILCCRRRVWASVRRCLLFSFLTSAVPNISRQYLSQRFLASKSSNVMPLYSAILASSSWICLFDIEQNALKQLCVLYIASNKSTCM